MYYIVDGEKIYIDENKRPIGKGTEGVCYKVGNQIYKIYYKSSIYEFGNNKSINHQYMIGIPTKQVILPNALIYHEDYSYAGYKTDIANGEKSVTKKQGISLLPSHNFVSNLKVLESDMKLLAYNYILVADLQPVNYFFDKEKGLMQIIDPGRYRVERFCHDDTKEEDSILKTRCNKLNQKQLEALITILIYNDLVKYKPLNSKAKLQKLRDYIKEDKSSLSYSEYFSETLKNYEDANTYFKSLGKYIR